MTHAAAILLALLCVCLTALAQVLLKLGMSAPMLQQALGKGLLPVYAAAASSPMIWGGMLCFGASAGLWLLVLGRLDVSLAYPLTSLGIALTAVTGIFLLGEAVTPWKLLGVGLILAGVMTLSLKA
jgi:multidrug transporter EmrE-like cation transporter